MTETQYQKTCDQQAWEEDFIASRMAIYMANRGECDPYQADNFCEAIAEADDRLLADLDVLLGTEKLDYWAIGKTICDWVQEHCEKEARQMAEDDLEEEQNRD